MVKRTWLVIETQNLSISAGRRSNPRPCQAFANSRLISCNVSAMWLYALLILEVLFFRVPAGVCESQLHLCLTFDIGIKNKLRIQFFQIGLIKSQKYLL